MNTGWRWYYEVQYKRRETVVILYEEHEICIDTAWIREQKLLKNFMYNKASEKAEKAGRSWNIAIILLSL